LNIHGTTEAKELAFLTFVVHRHAQSQRRIEMASPFAFIRNLSRERKRLWGIGASIFVVGTTFKFAYFQFSRGLMVDDMDARHLRAKAHLEESRRFAQWAEKDRNDRAPELTDDQRKQLQAYLELMATFNPDVHPVPPKAS